MRACPLTELGFRNSDTLGKKKICDLKQVWCHLIPQWASPETHWEPWAPLWDLCDCHTQLLWPQLVPLCALKWHLPMEGAFLPDGRTEMGRERLCVFLPGCPGPVQGLLSAMGTAGLPSSQISFIERDFWATLCLVPSSQGIMPLHWGTLVTFTRVLVRLLCPGCFVFFFHSCSPKNLGCYTAEKLVPGWF